MRFFAFSLFDHHFCSAVFRNFFKGGQDLRFQEIRGGKPNWMQNLLSDLGWLSLVANDWKVTNHA